MLITFQQLLEKYISEGVCCFDDLTLIETQRLIAGIDARKRSFGAMGIYQ